MFISKYLSLFIFRVIIELILGWSGIYNKFRKVIFIIRELLNNYRNFVFLKEIFYETFYF